MPDHSAVLAAVLVTAAITWAMRALPFAMLAPLRDSELLGYVGERMPVGLMLILAVYTLRGVDTGSLTSVGPAVLALAVTIGLHAWLGRATLSIFAGTGVYVLLSSLIAA